MPNTPKQPGKEPDKSGTKVEVDRDGKRVPGGQVIETGPDTGSLPPTQEGSHGHKWQEEEEKKKKKS